MAALLHSEYPQTTVSEFVNYKWEIFCDQCCFCSTWNKNKIAVSYCRKLFMTLLCSMSHVCMDQFEVCCVFLEVSDVCCWACSVEEGEHDCCSWHKLASDKLEPKPSLLSLFLSHLLSLSHSLALSFFLSLSHLLSLSLSKVWDGVKLVGWRL